jgi:site-specific recombinase XerD
LSSALWLRAMIVMLWRGGLRVQEALALSEHDLDPCTRVEHP